ncbi:MAG TPA: hypothetical protein VN455_05335 [Methanotrichaceae archaeon]|nr:hypothetical protein [Methanotrichaceae archaeon]
MKWLGKIFKKDRPEKKEVEGLALSNLGAWLDEQSHSPEFEARTREIYDQIKGLSGDLGDDLRSLKTAVPDKDTRPKLLNAGLAARDAVLNQLSELVEKMVPPEKPEIDSATAYHSSIVKHLGNTVMKFGRAKGYAAILFPDQSKKINADLSKLSHLLADLGNEIESRQSEQAQISASREILTRVLEARGKAEVLRKEIDDLEKRLKELQASEEMIRQDLNALASSDEGLRARTIRDELEHRRAEAGQIVTEMNGLVSPLSKALARMVKLDDSERLSLDHRRTIELLSSSPQEAPAGDIADALLELKANLDSLGVKEKQREKILGQVDRLIASRALEDLRSRYTQLSKEILDLEKSLSESCRQSTGLESSLVEVGEKRQSLEAGLAKSRESLATIEERASRDELELKGCIEKIAGRQLSIKDDQGRNI